MSLSPPLPSRRILLPHLPQGHPTYQHKYIFIYLTASLPGNACPWNPTNLMYPSSTLKQAILIGWKPCNKVLFQRNEYCYTQECVAAVIAGTFGYERKNLLSALSVPSDSGDLVGSYLERIVWNRCGCSHYSRLHLSRLWVPKYIHQTNRFITPNWRLHNYV